MSEAPDRTELATTQLLPYLAARGNVEAWRAFIVRYRPMPVPGRVNRSSFPIG